MQFVPELYEQIREEVEKLFSTAIGLLSSLLFGDAVYLKVSSPEMGWLLAYVIEVVSKSGIAIFSGVFTYFAIFCVKKVLNHDTGAKDK
jgi:hypothetical protein